MHNVSLIRILTLFRYVFVLVVRLLADDTLRINGLYDFFFGEVLGLKILTQGSLLIINVEFFCCFVKNPLGS